MELTVSLFRTVIGIHEDKEMLKISIGFVSLPAARSETTEDATPKRFWSSATRPQS